MAVWFHGTTQENAEKILQEGFQPGTYFGKHLEDAVHFGGGYVFEVYFKEAPTKNWQWRCSEVIPPSAILNLIRYQPEVVHWSPEAARQMKANHFEEEGFTICDTCDGRGQMEAYPPLTHWRDRETCTVCKDCGGYGSRDKRDWMRSQLV